MPPAQIFQSIKNWIRNNPIKSVGAGLGTLGTGYAANKALRADPFNKALQKNWTLDPSIANAIAGAGIGTALGAGGGALMGLISPNKKKGRIKSMLDNMLYGGGLGALGGGAVGGLGTEAVRMGLPYAAGLVPGLGLAAPAAYGSLSRKNQFGLIGKIPGLGNLIDNQASNFVQEQAGNVAGMFGKSGSARSIPSALGVLAGTACMSEETNKQAALDPAIANALGLGGVSALGGGAFGALSGLLNPGYEENVIGEDSEGNKIITRMPKARLSQALYGGLSGALAGGLGGAAVGGLGTEAMRAMPLLKNYLKRHQLKDSPIGGPATALTHGEDTVWKNLPRDWQHGYMSQEFKDVYNNPLSRGANTAVDTLKNFAGIK